MRFCIQQSQSGYLAQLTQFKYFEIVQSTYRKNTCLCINFPNHDQVIRKQCNNILS